MVNELMRRRGLLLGSGSAVDWEDIVRTIVSQNGGGGEFVFPSGVTALLQYGLYGTSFTKVVIPDTVAISVYHEYAFCAQMESLTEIDFGSGLTRIDERFCQGCTALTSVTIPSQITNIDYQAFQECTSLAEVVCKSTTPPTLGGYAFASDNALAAIYVPDASVSTYKGTSGWSTYSSIIKAISQRPT